MERERLSQKNTASKQCGHARGDRLKENMSVKDYKEIVSPYRAMTEKQLGFILTQHAQNHDVSISCGQPFLPAPDDTDCKQNFGTLLYRDEEYFRAHTHEISDFHTQILDGQESDDPFTIYSTLFIISPSCIPHGSLALLQRRVDHHCARVSIHKRRD